MLKRLPIASLCLIASTAWIACPAAAEPEAPPASPPAATAAKDAPSPKDALTPKDAGARYGQALGAIEICHGSKVTDKAEALTKSFAGADQETFKAQAAKIYDCLA